MTILVVEDHRDTREMFVQALEQHGAVVQQSASAQMALFWMESTRPDLVILDIELPDVDGWALMEAMRRLYATRTVPPVIAVTAHNAPDDRRRSLLAGFRLHLDKPIDGDRLAAVAAAILTSLRAPP